MIIAGKQPITTIAATYQRRHRSLSVPQSQLFRATIAAHSVRICLFGAKLALSLQSAKQIALF